MKKNINKIIDGKAYADKFLAKILKKTNLFNKSFQRKPFLAVLIVGEDPASQIYVRNKVKKAKEVNIDSLKISYPADVSEKKILNQIDKLNLDHNVDGILIQLPLPKHISEQKVINAISPSKDVDGFNPINLGNLVLGNNTIVPCTPLGCLYLLKKEVENLSGMNVVVIGRSNIVGKPMQLLLIKENCTVTIAHSQTKKLKSITRSSDIIISAVGKSEFLNKDYINPNSIIIDVGINRKQTLSKPKIVGDVKFEEVLPLVKKITPVPGGVGPMTIACLMHNTVKTSFLRKGQPFFDIL